MTPGQEAYERDLAKRPNYDDGRPRPPWSELKPWAQDSWERDPSDRPAPGEEVPEPPKPLPQGLLDIDTLRQLNDDVMKAEDPCLYFLWGGTELLYIGGTTQPCDRIARHIRDRNRRSAQSGRPIPFDRVTFLQVSDRMTLWQLEEKYQIHYDPPFNVVSYRRRLC